MTQLAHSTGLFRVSRKHTPHTAEQRLFGIVFAIAMEAGIVYALLVALGYVETPLPPPPITIIKLAPPPNNTTDPLPPPQTFEPPPVQPAISPVIELTYMTPTPQTAISLPPPIPMPPTRETRPPAPPVVFTPARALAATHTIPEYPFVSRRLREQGTLRLKLVVDEKGFVTEATVVNSSGFARLDEAAVTWVKTHWRYTPAMEGAKPVRSNADAIVEFRLQ
jgi:periplasmic protein TonB